MLIENTSRSVRRAPEEHNKKKHPYRCDVINYPFFSKKYVTTSQNLLLPIFFFLPFFVLNPFNSISFQTEVFKNL
jgi:TRAP-type mannitol/chloroaromatic compound transport system permease small subunit